MKAVGAALGGLYFAAMFFVVMPGFLLWGFDVPLRPPLDALGIAALGVIVIGNLAVAGLVVQFLREGQGTQIPIAPPRFLVRGGIYRHMRNPMYLAYLCIIAGEVALYRTPVLAVYGLACVALAHGYVLHEERLLLARFGEDYRRYLDAVPRWFPRR